MAHNNREITEFLERHWAERREEYGGYWERQLTPMQHAVVAVDKVRGEGRLESWLNELGWEKGDFGGHVWRWRDLLTIYQYADGECAVSTETVRRRYQPSRNLYPGLLAVAQDMAYRPEGGANG